MIYLDNAATTPVRREVLEAIWPHLAGGFGNPSSHHRVGEAAAATLAEARQTVARVLGCRQSEVVFTSGGTEAANLGVLGIALGAPRGRHIITTPTEHEAVLESCDHLRRLHGFEITQLATDASGLVDPEELRRVIRPGTTLVSVQYANNEVGTVQPIDELAQVAHGAGAPFHTDAVQAAGWLPLDVAALGVDALGIS
ncbi:MAG TPA: aminotransferase class V-fold PLP-dependent enzyme, partial [Cryobacterium sp.]|nr:aminotransferase class V-fold PLP-dependent enzyme [Cryobacterium sp.]